MKHKWILNEEGKPDEWAFDSGFHNGVVCEVCRKEVCVHCHPDYSQMNDCPGPPAKKIITHLDRIRTMQITELAKLFTNAAADGCPPDMEWDCTKGEEGWDGCDDCWEKWLQQPVKED